MAKKAGPKSARKPAGPLFLTEWMDKLEITDAVLAARLGLPVTTIWRWQNSKTRLNPVKQVQVAKALGLPWPGMLWIHPKARGLKILRVVIEDDSFWDRPVDE